MDYIISYPLFRSQESNSKRGNNCNKTTHTINARDGFEHISFYLTAKMLSHYIFPLIFI